MTHWSWRTGAGLLVATYLALGALVYWGPPPVKVWAGAILLPLPPWTMEISIMAFGAYVAKDWGHGGELADGGELTTFEKVEQLAEFVIEVSQVFDEVGQCDPTSIMTWCQDDKWMTPDFD